MPNYRIDFLILNDAKMRGNKFVKICKFIDPDPSAGKLDFSALTHRLFKLNR
jgi:hypothetical protein